jgi:hypothetical protein
MNGTRTAVNNDGAVERATRIVLRPIANPLPLGFLALGAGTLVVAGLQLDWFAATEGRSVALILLAFVFPLQLLAAIFGFFARDVVAGTGMGVLCNVARSRAGDGRRASRHDERCAGSAPHLRVCGPPRSCIRRDNRQGPSQPRSRDGRTEVRDDGSL